MCALAYPERTIGTRTDFGGGQALRHANSFDREPAIVTPRAPTDQPRPS